MPLDEVYCADCGRAFTQSASNEGPAAGAYCPRCRDKHNRAYENAAEEARRNLLAAGFDENDAFDAEVRRVAGTVLSRRIENSGGWGEKVRRCFDCKCIIDNDRVRCVDCQRTHEYEEEKREKDFKETKARAEKDAEDTIKRYSR